LLYTCDREGDFRAAAAVTAAMTVTIKNDNKTPLLVPAPWGGRPEQRRAIDTRLKMALEEVKQGHAAGPFNTSDEMIASLKGELKQSGTKKTKRRSR